MGNHPVSQWRDSMNTQKINLSLPENPGRLQTQYIQAALDRCRETGGVVTLAEGEWHIGSLRLYSNTTLHLSSGTRLIASDRIEDYENFHVPSTLGYLKSPWVCDAWHLPDHYILAPIVAFGAENVAVTGDPGAVIDGSDCFDRSGEEKFRGPMGMVFCKCRNVTLMGYTYQNSANWAHQIDSCTGVHMDGVTVLAGHDGVNIHHCVGVTIENCDFRTGDDCIAGYNAENVIVRNCSLNTSCNSFRFGGRNLLVESCRFWGPGVYPHRVSGRHNTLFAFEYYALRYDDVRVDSENWLIRNCTMDNLDGLLDYRYGVDFTHDARPLRDVTFENVTITGLKNPAIFNPVPGNPLCVTLRNVTMGRREGAPEERMFYTSPDVKMILENVKIQGLNA